MNAESAVEMVSLNLIATVMVITQIVMESAAVMLVPMSAVYVTVLVSELTQDTVTVQEMPQIVKESAAVDQQSMNAQSAVVVVYLKENVIVLGLNQTVKVPAVVLLLLTSAAYVVAQVSELIQVNVTAQVKSWTVTAFVVQEFVRTLAEFAVDPELDLISDIVTVQETSQIVPVFVEEQLQLMSVVSVKVVV